MSLWVKIKPTEIFNEDTNEFILIEEQSLEFEHSLVSLSKWEAKHHKYFISNPDISYSEMVDYIRCMCLSDVSDTVLSCLTKDHIEEISKYISDPMTATKFYRNGNSKRSDERVTSELIYYWMIVQNIPVEFQHWHLNRLLTLIRLCSSKQEKPKKMSQSEIMRQNSRINAARRARLNSKG